jgi:molybdopterin-containing oxidoreductase family iron-sulfur binding subunit
MGKDESSASSRRNFLKKFGAGMGAVSIAGTSLMASGSSSPSGSGEKVRLLSPDGKLVEVDRDAISLPEMKPVDLREKARKGIPNRKFAMVVDLSRCGNARKCVEACQEGHMLSRDHEWMKLYLLQDSEKGLSGRGNL